MYSGYESAVEGAGDETCSPRGSRHVLSCVLLWWHSPGGVHNVRKNDNMVGHKRASKVEGTWHKTAPLVAGDSGTGTEGNAEGARACVHRGLLRRQGRRGDSSAEVEVTGRSARQGVL